MSLHLIKLAVGVDSPDHLRAIHQERARTQGRMFTRTRMIPRRTAEILAGGSLYWVIKGITGLRQPILGLDVPDKDEEGRPFCDIILGVPVAVEAFPRRPFQGWRYLKTEDAPPDLGATPGGALPADMAADLRRLGLL